MGGLLALSRGIDRVNTLARGAIEGAMQAMDEPQLLAAGFRLRVRGVLKRRAPNAGDAVIVAV